MYGHKKVYLLMSNTILVMMAARRINPPNTPKAMIPPGKFKIWYQFNNMQKITLCSKPYHAILFF